MLLYIYFFNLKRGDTNEEQAIYAASEDDARKKFKKYFDVEAGKLLRRTNW